MKDDVMDLGEISINSDNNLQLLSGRYMNIHESYDRFINVCGRVL